MKNPDPGEGRGFEAQSRVGGNGLRPSRNPDVLGIDALSRTPTEWWLNAALAVVHLESQRRRQKNAPVPWGEEPGRYWLAWGLGEWGCREPIPEFGVSVADGTLDLDHAARIAHPTRLHDAVTSNLFDRLLYSGDGRLPLEISGCRRGSGEQSRKTHQGSDSTNCNGPEHGTLSHLPAGDTAGPLNDHLVTHGY